LPLAKASGAFGLPVDVNGGESEASSYHDTEPDRGSAPVVAEPVFETVGPVVEQRAEVSSYHDAEPDRELPSVPESLSAVVEEQAAEVSSYHHNEPDRELLPVAESVFESVSPIVEQAAEVSSYHHTEPDRELLPVAETVFESTGPMVEETAEVLSPGAPQTPEPAEAPSITDLEATTTLPVQARGEVHAGGGEAAAIDFEPIGQGQPIPYQMPVSAAEPPIVRRSADPILSPKRHFQRACISANNPTCNHA
jgi:hypothetical protein